MQRYIPKKRIFYVYILFRPWDGSPCYVGKGNGKRWMHHAKVNENHQNKELAKIFKKARRLNLEVPAIKIRQNIPEIEAFALEKIFIKAIGRKKDGGPLVNATDGGEGIHGTVLSEEAVEKIKRKVTELWQDPEYREMMIAIRQTPEYREELGKVNRGKKFDEEWCANISKGLTGRTLSVEHCANISKSQKGKKYSLGYKHTPEWKEEARKRMLGNKHAVGRKQPSKPRKYKQKKPRSIEHCRKISESKLGKKQSLEHRKKNSIALTKFSRTKEGRALRRKAALIRWKKIKEPPQD